MQGDTGSAPGGRVAQQGADNNVSALDKNRSYSYKHKDESGLAGGSRRLNDDHATTGAPFRNR